MCAHLDEADVVTTNIFGLGRWSADDNRFWRSAADPAKNSTICETWPHPTDHVYPRPAYCRISEGPAPIPERPVNPQVVRHVEMLPVIISCLTYSGGLFCKTSGLTDSVSTSSCGCGAVAPI